MKSFVEINIPNKPDKRLGDLIEYYREIYGLKKLENIIDVSSPVFNYCTQGQTFVSVILVNTATEIYYRHTLNKFSGWETPGGFVDKKDKSLEEAAVRIVKSESGLSVDELCPLAVLVNRFIAGEKHHSHYGMVFIALVRNNDVAIKSNDYIGNFMKKVPEQIVSYDKIIVDFAVNYLKGHKLNPPLNEIDETSHLGWRYTVHNLAVRPTQRILSSRTVRNAVVKEIVGKSVIDVSCGDDTMLINFANTHPEIKCVVNDICWYTLEKLIHRSKWNNVIFTDHDLSRLPFRSGFDTLIFKNTLHHFSYGKGKDVIKKLFLLTKSKMIIVDVEDPKTTGFGHALWNKYYASFLHDQGNHFWQFNQFRKLIEAVLPGADFKRIITNRGNYMFAIYKVNKQKKRSHEKTN